MASIDLTFGALLDGFALALVMYGVLCAQAVWYYRTYPNDIRPFKILVGVLCATESLHFVLMTNAMWHYLVVRASVDPLFFLRVHWSLQAEVLPTEVCIVLVETFFILRIWKLCDRNKYALLAFIPVLVGTAHVIGFTVIIAKHSLFADSHRVRYVTAMTASVRLLADLAIAGTMCGLLYARQATIAQQSKSLLHALFVWTITTGLLTSVFTLVYFITYITMPENMVFIAAYRVHGKIYVNTMLASLNTRNALRSLSDRDIALHTRLGLRTPGLAEHPQGWP